MSKKDDFSDWLFARYWEARRAVDDLEHQRREVEERLVEERAVLRRLDRLHDRWLHEQGVKPRERG